MKSDPYLTPHTKITPKWIEIINIKPSTIKLLEENIVKKLNDIGFEKDFLDMIQKAQVTKVSIDKLDYIKI